MVFKKNKWLLREEKDIEWLVYSCQYKKCQKFHSRKLIIWVQNRKKKKRNRFSIIDDEIIWVICFLLFYTRKTSEWINTLLRNLFSGSDLNWIELTHKLILQNYNTRTRHFFRLTVWTPKLKLLLFFIE